MPEHSCDSMREAAAAVLEQAIKRYAGAPDFKEMERRSLKAKGIAGPTAAHVIEEVHVPLNYAYITFTTGTSAFQTPVGVTKEELKERKQAAKSALSFAGVEPGKRMLVTYPPLVNVFSGEALREYGTETVFLERSCREALLASWCRREGTVTIGESSFLRAALEDAKRMGISGLLPEQMVLLAAGTPLDMELLELTKNMPGWRVHDLYGCQEFGWLALDGVFLRDDIILVHREREPKKVYPVVGGLAVGDCFRRGKHCLNADGVLSTHSREMDGTEWETWIEATAVLDRETVKRTAKSILRMKSRVVRLKENMQCGQGETRVVLKPVGGGEEICITGPEKTRLLDSLLEAQKAYQGKQKRDSTWRKDISR